jgi:hypothetical protein
MRFIIRKSFSLMDWLIVFSVLLAVLAMFRGTVKRTVAGKVRAVGNFMLWDNWAGSSTTGMGGGPQYWTAADGTPVKNPEQAADPNVNQLFKNDLNVQTKSGSTVAMAQNAIQQRGTVIYTSNQTHDVRTATIGTARDQEYLFANQGVDNIPVNIDTR